MDDIKLLKRSAILAIVTILILLASITASTYAWFTFTSSALVEPMQGSVSGGGVILLISNSIDGEFTEYCDLVLSNNTKNLYPMTTSDLLDFYVPSGQDSNGFPTGYTKKTKPDTYALHGKVYLLALGTPCYVYFDKSKLYFGENEQALAAMRLGLSIKTEAGRENFIFKLDDMGDTSKAESHWTIEKHGSVYGGEYVNDPAIQIDPFCAEINGETVIPARRRLVTLTKNDIAEVDYWLYIEGCDPNCINSVQRKDIGIKLGFAGSWE